MLKWFVKSQFGIYFLTHDNEKAHIKFEEYGELSALTKRIMANGLTIEINTSQNIPAALSLYESIYVPANRILLVVKY